jgi:hypothetical protein
MPARRIQVKFVARGFGVEDAIWRRQFPGGLPVWDECEFLLDPAAPSYDWLVVYDDLPPRGGESFSKRREPLACPRSRTLLITTEPSSIKFYGRRYVAQFGHVLSSQEPHAIRHPNLIHSQPALRWFYGLGTKRLRTWDELQADPPLQKSRVISTVCSSKSQRHTLHHRRVHFTRELQALLPGLEVFGHGVRDMDDKAEALDDFRYHVAVENHLAPHHWTEKLADAFLGCTLPFYFGCPNVANYFPAESYIPIDIRQPRETASVIRNAIENDEHTRRLPAIMEARRLVLERYNLPAVVSRIIQDRHTHTNGEPGGQLLSRALMRRKAPIGAVGDWLCKMRLRVQPKFACATAERGSPQRR